jgi:hypothetical protein
MPKVGLSPGSITAGTSVRSDDGARPRSHRLGRRIVARLYNRNCSTELPRICLAKPRRKSQAVFALWFFALRPARYTATRWRSRGSAVSRKGATASVSARVASENGTSRKQPTSLIGVGCGSINEGARRYPRSSPCRARPGALEPLGYVRHRRSRGRRGRFSGRMDIAWPILPNVQTRPPTPPRRDSGGFGATGR